MTQVINLDLLVDDAPIAVTVKGKTYKMQTPTLSNMVQNMKEIEALGMNPSMLTEIEASIRIIQRAFPDLKEGVLMELNLKQLTKLGDFARGASGEIATPDAEEAQSGNAQKAS